MIYLRDERFSVSGAQVLAVIVSGASGMLQTELLVQLQPLPGDVRQYNGTDGTFASGRPEVNTTHAAGTAWGSGAITRASLAADTGLQSLRSGTAQAGASGSVTLDAGASSTNDFFATACVIITGGTGAGQYRIITAYSGSTKVASVTPNWVTNPDSSSTFAIIANGLADARELGGVVQTGRDIGASVLLSNGTGTGQVKLSGGYVAPNWADVGNASSNVSLSNTSIASVTGNVGAVSGDVGGKVRGQGSSTIVGPGVQSADTDGTTTLLSRLTSTRADYLDNLSGGAVLTSAGYTAPPSAASIRAEIDSNSTQLAAIATAIAELPNTSAIQASCDAALVDYDVAAASDIPSVPSSSDNATAVWAAGTRTLTDKTGFKLASDGLDAITTTAPTGVASNFREMLVQLWRRFFKKATKSSTQIKTYADDGTTVVTTQTISESGSDETQGAAS